MAYDPYDLWDGALTLADVDAMSYAAANFDYSVIPPSDSKLTADVTAAKATATANGNTKLANTLDFILKYGDKALEILTKNGILQNKNLATAGYSLDLSSLSKDAATNSAPDTSNRVFNLDFSDPKTLIITFLVIMILVYFLFFNSNKQHGRR